MGINGKITFHIPGNASALILPRYNPMIDSKTIEPIACWNMVPIREIIMMPLRIRLGDEDEIHF